MDFSLAQTRVETADIEASEGQLHSEGFGAYQWKGTPGAAYLDYIHT